MQNPPRNLAFILAASDQGTFIVNRFDAVRVSETKAVGVGGNMLASGSYCAVEAGEIEDLLRLRREFFGAGVVAIDCGANIGIFTVQWAKAMIGWGAVLAIEAQERLFYALAGNIVLNNCLNARAAFAAVGSEVGLIQVPIPNYEQYASFGSLELRPHPNVENIGQPIDYTQNLIPTPLVTIDHLALPRIDLLKIDVERMENEVLEGAKASIARCLPIIVIESVKSDVAVMHATLEAHGYRKWQINKMNILAIHPSDPTLNHLEELGMIARLD